MSPTAFEISQSMSNTFGNLKKKRRDVSAIDEILTQANQSGDPEDLNNAMNQILSRVSPERQQAALSVLEKRYKEIQSRLEGPKKESAYSEAGLDPSIRYLDPKAQAQIIKGKQSQQAYNNIVGQSSNKNMPAQESGQIQASFQQEPSQAVSSKSGISALNDDQLVALTGVSGYSEPAKQELKRRQEDRTIEHKKSETKASRDTDISKKVLEKADVVAEGIPQKQTALRLMNDAVSRKDLSFWSGDNLAAVTGLTAFESPEGALFKTASKEYFLGNISRAGARPNQWIEKQILEMLPKIGRSTEANLSVTRALENELDLDQERVRVTSKISEDLEKKLGYVPRDLGVRVNEELKIYADKKQNELFNDLRAIKSIAEKKQQKLSKVSEGTPVSKFVAKSLLLKNNNDWKKAEEEAKSLGYTF